MKPPDAVGDFSGAITTFDGSWPQTTSPGSAKPVEKLDGSIHRESDMSWKISSKTLEWRNIYWWMAGWWFLIGLS